MPADIGGFPKILIGQKFGKEVEVMKLSSFFSKIRSLLYIIGNKGTPVKQLSECVRFCDHLTFGDSIWNAFSGK